MQTPSLSPPKPRDHTRIIGMAILVFALCATGIAGYLTWHAFAGTGVGGCSASSTFGCDEVLSTKWSKWLQIPVALFATLNYLLIATAAGLLLMGTQPTKRLALVVMLPTAFLATAAAFWFTGLQLFEVQKLCKWCLTTHTCGIIIGALVSLLVLLTWRQSLWSSADYPEASILPSRTTCLATIGLASFAFVGLLMGQLFSADTIEIVDLSEMAATAAPTLQPSGPVELSDTPQAAAATAEYTEPETPLTTQPDFAVTPTTVSEQETEATQASHQQQVPNTPPGVTIFPNRPPIPRSELIWVGNPDAEHVLIEFASYTCPSCRNAHPLIKQVQAEVGDQLAIVVMPVGLEKSCNPAVKKDHAKNRDSCKLTRLALAVWELDHAAFAQLHDWMMSSEDARRYNKAWQMACSMVSESELIDMVRSDQVRRRLSQHSEYMEKFDALPAVILGSKMIKGRAVYEGEHLRKFVLGAVTST